MFNFRSKLGFKNGSVKRKGCLLLKMKPLRWTRRSPKTFWNWNVNPVGVQESYLSNQCQIWLNPVLRPRHHPCPYKEIVFLTEPWMAEGNTQDFFDLNRISRMKSKVAFFILLFLLKKSHVFVMSAYKNRSKFLTTTFLLVAIQIWIHFCVLTWQKRWLLSKTHL